MKEKGFFPFLGKTLFIVVAKGGSGTPLVCLGHTLRSRLLFMTDHRGLMWAQDDADGKRTSQSSELILSCLTALFYSGSHHASHIAAAQKYLLN